MWRQSVRQVGGIERGFTLLEVLVALALIGIGFSTTFSVVSGVHKLEDRASAQSAAILFARSTLDEFIEAGALGEGDVPGGVRFGGHDFSYRLTVRPFKISGPGGVGREEDSIKLDQVDIEVFWGSVGMQQSYRLATLVSRSKRAASAAKTPASAPILTRPVSR